jgi:hypothetical protein
MDVGVEALARVWFGKAFPNKYHFRVMRRELYDLSEDRGETLNISNENVAVQRELGNYLWEWIEATYRTGILPEVQGRDLATDKDLLEKLRGLGYVE